MMLRFPLTNRDACWLDRALKSVNCSLCIRSFQWVVSSARENMERTDVSPAHVLLPAAFLGSIGPSSMMVQWIVRGTGSPEGPPEEAGLFIFLHLVPASPIPRLLRQGRIAAHAENSCENQ